MPIRILKKDEDTNREKGLKKSKMLTGGQAKIAAKAPPPNKIDEKDFAVLKAEKAKGRGTGLQDESKKPGKIYKAALGLAFMKKAKDKGAKGAEFLSPIAMAKRMFNKKAGGVMKYKRGMGPGGLDLPVISSVKPAVHTTKKAVKTAVMKEQFNKQKSRMGKNPNSKTTTMAEMRKAKGFKPGESATEFNKRRMKLAGAAKALSATRIGKIALGVGTAGVATQQYLKSKMNKKKDVKKKMGGGMIEKLMANKKSFANPISPVTMPQDRKNQTTGPVLKPYDRKNQTTGPVLKPYDRKNQTTGPVLKPQDKMGGGMMKKPMGYKGGGMDTGRVGEMKSRIAVAVDRIKKAKKSMGIGSGPIGGGRLTDSDKEKIKSLIGKNKAARPITRNMGGMMMKKPMGYNTGGFKSKQDRKKAEKNIKEARSTEGLRSFLSGRTNPMRKDRYMEGRKARHTEFKKKIGKSALGVLGSLIPSAAAAKVAKKVLGRGDKKRDFQKGDYGDISVKKNMGGMMQKPMGYKYGTSVKAKCKLGRNKPTKIT